MQGVAPADGDVFKIVTPAYNATRYLEETMLSVVSQVTRGTLCYHVQDGGSTDGTLDLIERWAERLDRGRFVDSTVKLHFSFASEPDTGMYDAINKGFRHLDVMPSDILTWINADDRLPQGALATVAQVLRDVPACRFLSGRISILTADGEITGVNAAHIYSQANLAAGLHDGRSLPFIMQEGTFFTGAVWLDVGGANTEFRLAGDWDLWRRIARKEEHYSLDTVTGFHRRRAGQLSEDMARYYREVDAAAPEPSRAETPAGQGNLIRHQGHTGTWVSVRVDPFASSPFHLVSGGVVEGGVPWRFLDGFGPPEGPYPEYDLPANVRWIEDHRGSVQIVAPETGRYTIRATLRPSLTRPLICFRSGSRVVYERELVRPHVTANSLVEFSCWLLKGESVIEIEIGSADADAPHTPPAERSLLLVSLEISTGRSLVRRKMTRGRVAAYGARDAGFAFVVHTVGHAERLDATLTSLVEAGAGRRTIFIEKDEDPLTLAIAASFEPYVETLSDLASISDDALMAKGHGMRFDVTAGDELLAGALDVARYALDEARHDVLAGLTDCFDAFGRATCRIIGGGSSLRVIDGAPDARWREIGFSLFSRREPTSGEIARGAPRVMLREAGDAGKLPLLLEVAKGFALLGCETSLVCDAAGGAIPRSGGFIEISCDGQSLRGEVALDEDRVRVTLEGGGEMTGLASEDVDAFRGVTRGQARHLFGIDAGCFAIAVLAHVDTTTADALLQLVSHIEKIRRVVIILCGGEIRDPELNRRVLVDLHETFNAQSRRYVLPAVDLFLQMRPSDERVATIAAMARTPFLSCETGGAELPALVDRIVALDRPLDEAWCRAVAWQSNEAFALSFREQAARLLPEGPIVQWLSQGTALAGGEVEVYTNDARLLNSKASCLLVPIVGAAWRPITYSDGLHDDVIACRSPHALLALEVRVTEAKAICLRVRVEEGGIHEIYVDDMLALSRWLDGKAEHELTFDAQIEPGTHSLALRRTADESAGDLVILDVEVLATTQSQRSATAVQSSFVFNPLHEREAKSLRRHGDWRRLDGFHQAEAAHPHNGLHEAFQWSKRTFKIDLWSARDVRCPLVVVVRGNHVGPKLRLRLRDTDYGFCEALGGLLASRYKRCWTVDVAQGRNRLEFEASSAGGTDRELGVILDRIYMEEPVEAAAGQG